LTVTIRERKRGAARAEVRTGYSVAAVIAVYKLEAVKRLV
jgi:hypothetical protein